jgi:ANTAR domain
MPAKRYRTLSPQPDLAAETAGQDVADRLGAASPPAPSSGLRPVAGEAPVVRRTADGWRVGDDELPDLTCAMVLADLIAADLAAAEQPTDVQPAIPAVPPLPGPGASALASDNSRGSRGAKRSGPGGRPGPSSFEPAGAGDSIAEEAHRLRTTVGQLEHALTARIRIEQAIGVLSERHRIRPRQAFEQLRSAARNRGRRVIDIASDVVASATNPLLQLPEELTRQRPAPRHAKNGRRALRLE